MSYLKKKKRQMLAGFLLCLSYNLYFIFLLPEVSLRYLLYLDFLIAFFGLFFLGADYLKYKKEKEKKAELLRSPAVIYQAFLDMENYDVLAHDVHILQEENRAQFEQNCDLQDYVAKWCHEIKIPLAASLLIAEKIEDGMLRLSLKEQLERMNWQLKSALLGCKLQGRLFDVQIKKTDLFSCVKSSVQNNKFFLIKNHFQIELSEKEIFVYSDPSWLVYILDQLIGNAIKYAMEQPVLKVWSSRKETQQEGQSAVQLFVEDNGEGIEDSDLRRIFEKGYTGSNHHNGKYKSTGMGLYMAEKIAQRLGHKISVESSPKTYTRFTIELLCYGNAFQPIS